MNIFLDDQTQVDSKPAGQPEHANLNQCQLIAANRLKLMLCAPPAGGGDKFLCNEIDARALIGPCSHVTFAVMPYLVLLARVKHVTIGHIIIGLSLHIHSFLHPRYIF